MCNYFIALFIKFHLKLVWTYVNYIRTDPAEVRNISGVTTRTSALLEWASPEGGTPDRYQMRLTSDQDELYAPPGLTLFLYSNETVHIFPLLLPSTDYTVYITSILDETDEFEEQYSGEEDYEFTSGEKIHFVRPRLNKSKVIL